MLKPIAAIRRKASSFRDTKLKPKIQPKAGAKRPPSIELDHYFSIDAFLHRIKPHRRRSTYEVAASTTTTSIPCLPPSRFLDELPATCLDGVFSNLDSSTLQSLRLTCRSFNSIIEKSKLIPRTPVNRLQLNGNGRGSIYRFSLQAGPLYDRYGFHESEIDKGLKLLIAKRITFDNVSIDATVSKALLKGIDYEVEEITFDFCHFQIS